MMMLMQTVNARAIAAAYLTRQKDEDARPYLCHLYLAYREGDEKPCVVSTDGYRMTTAETPKELAGDELEHMETDMVIPYELAALVAQRVYSNHNEVVPVEVRWSGEPGKGTVSIQFVKRFEEMTFTTTWPDVKSPDWRRVHDGFKAKRLDDITLNLNFIQDTIEAFEAFSWKRRKVPAAQITFGGPAAPLRYKGRNEDGHTIIVTVMPMRSEF